MGNKTKNNKMKIKFEISNISSKVFNYEIINLCKEFAIKGDCWVNIRKENSYCFVEYDNAKDAQDAFDYINGYEMAGLDLKVKVVKSDQVCFNWLNNGSCKAGGKCFYLHKKNAAAKKEHKALEFFKPSKIEVVETGPSKPKKEKNKPKKVVFSTPEPDYFKKAMDALPKEEPIEEQIKPKAVAEMPAWSVYSTSDTDSLINN